MAGLDSIVTRQGAPTFSSLQRSDRWRWRTLHWAPLRHEQ